MERGYYLPLETSIDLITFKLPSEQNCMKHVLLFQSWESGFNMKIINLCYCDTQTFKSLDFIRHRYLIQRISNLSNIKQFGLQLRIHLTLRFVYISSSYLVTLAYLKCFRCHLFYYSRHHFHLVKHKQ